MPISTTIRCADKKERCNIPVEDDDEEEGVGGGLVCVDACFLNDSRAS